MINQYPSGLASLFTSYIRELTDSIREKNCACFEFIGDNEYCPIHKVNVSNPRSHCYCGTAIDRNCPVHGGMQCQCGTAVNPNCPIHGEIVTHDFQKNGGVG